MKSLIVVLILSVLYGCSEPERATEAFPKVYEVEDELIIYEGILPGQSGFDVFAELKLKPAAPGLDSYYWLSESLHEADAEKYFMGAHNRGTYAVLSGTDGGYLIQILNRKRMKEPIVKEPIVRGAKFHQPDYVTDDVYLRSDGPHKLVLVDEDFQDVSPRYTLTRRSDLFTAEGYFTVNPDSTTEFFEKNTRKTWPVARLGYFDDAVSNYHWIAKEKYEGVYLKALSYSVLQTDKDGKEHDVLVFKKILQMNATKALE